MTPDKKQKMSRNWLTLRRDASKTDEIMAKCSIPSTKEFEYNCFCS